MVIIRAWESPRNEGSAEYKLGSRVWDRDWTVGDIVITPGVDEWPPTVDIYDFGGNLRVELPISSVAIEYGVWSVN